MRSPRRRSSIIARWPESSSTPPPSCLIDSSVPQCGVIITELFSPMNSLKADPKHLLGSLILSGILALIFILANLPWTYVELNGTWRGATEFASTQFEPVESLPTMAGWPFRYSIRFSSNGMSVDRYWSPMKLVLNAVIGLMGCGMAFGLRAFRDPRSWQGLTQRRGKTAFDVGLAAIILLVPTGILGYARWETLRHEVLADRIVERGNCFTSAWLPRPIAGAVPSGVLPWMARVRRVQVILPDRDLTRQLSELPTLVKLECFGGTSDVPAMASLADRHFLRCVGLIEQDITPEKIDLIAGLPWLTSLNLSGTNLSTPLLRQLDALDKLQFLDLSRTDLKLLEIGSPAWRKSLVKLLLTRPDADASDRLTMSDWPLLESLSIVRQSIERNTNPLEVRLSDMPMLTALRLDRIQKHRLFLEDLPSLVSIQDDVSPDQFLLDRRMWIPGLGWYETLVLKDLPSLVRVTSFERDLEFFQFHNLPNLRELEIGSNIEDLLDAEVSPPPVTPERYQMWVDEIGKMDGPHTVTLSGINLDHVDLSKLAKNQSIRQLRFAASQVSFEQAMGLDGMENLRELDLGDCSIEQDQLSWFIKQFPSLESLRINGGKLSNLELIDGQNLKHLEVSTLHEIDSIRIVDQPKLTSFLRVERTPTTLEIRNARSLSGLVVNHPWPKSAVVTGLRDIHWFATGGSEVDDSLLDVLLKCPTIDQLTLAYPSLSRDALCRIGELRQLTVLMIPGASVDDEITESWRDLKSLWEINLDDNRVGVGTIAWLSTIHCLRAVSLNRVPLSEAAAESLCELNQLSSLSLRGVKVDPSHLAKLLNSNALELLDLSETDVDSQVLEMAGRSIALRMLVMKGCNFDPEALAEALQRNVNLAVTLDAVTAPTHASGLAGDDDHGRVFRPVKLDTQTQREIDRRMTLFRKQLQFYETDAALIQSLKLAQTDPPPLIPASSASMPTAIESSEKTPAPPTELARMTLDTIIDSEPPVQISSDQLTAPLEAGRIDLEALREMIHWSPATAGKR